jgi:glucose-6-phosphate 1-epimerase
MPTAQLPRQITAVHYAGHSALQLRTRHGTAVIALHGAHVLSWVPAGGREVFWLSPASLPEPAAIRGGVPVCWPWFAKQGQSADAAQHGPVRNLPWQLTGVSHGSDEEITISMEPAAQTNAAPHEAWAAGVPAGLRLRVRISLGSTLQQSLHTDNLGTETFLLSQALHSYYAVSHAQQVSIEGLQGLAYTDRLRALAQAVQDQSFALGLACDRTYEHPPVTPAPEFRRYTLVDTAWQRRIDIDVTGSRSVVVWNPGSETARQMVDVPDDDWSCFFCIEAANAGPDVIRLAPGGSHQLTQTLSVTSSAVQAA